MARIRYISGNALAQVHERMFWTYIQASNTLTTLNKIHYKSPLIFKYFFSVTRTQNWSKIWSFFSSDQGEKKRLCKSDEHTVQCTTCDLVMILQRPFFNLLHKIIRI